MKKYIKSLQMIDIISFIITGMMLLLIGFTNS